MPLAPLSILRSGRDKVCRAPCLWDQSAPTWFHYHEKKRRDQSHQRSGQPNDQEVILPEDSYYNDWLNAYNRNKTARRVDTSTEPVPNAFRPNAETLGSFNQNTFASSVRKYSPGAGSGAREPDQQERTTAPSRPPASETELPLLMQASSFVNPRPAPKPPTGTPDPADPHSFVNPRPAPRPPNSLLANDGLRILSDSAPVANQGREKGHHSHRTTAKLHKPPPAAGRR